MAGLTAPGLTMINSLKEFIIIALLWFAVGIQLIILNSMGFPKEGIFFFSFTLGIVVAMTVNRLKSRH